MYCEKMVVDMHIYIDESGNFLIPKVTKSKVSCIGALIVPAIQKEEIFDRFKEIKKKWGYTSEIKGSQLNEYQISEIIDFLSGYNILLEISAIDNGSHTLEQVNEFKKEQASRILNSVKIIKSESIKNWIYEIYLNISKLSNQLFLQLVTKNELIRNVIQSILIYYVIKFPFELKEFNWNIDAKDTNITNYEDVWKNTILPYLKFCSQLNPFIFIKEANYEYFNNFYSCGPNQNKIDLKKLMENINFINSVDNEGIQIIDILTNAFTRAMNNNLSENGWENIGKLILKKSYCKQKSLSLICLDNHTSTIDNTIKNNHYNKVEKIIESKTVKVFKY